MKLVETDIAKIDSETQNGHQPHNGSTPLHLVATEQVNANGHPANYRPAHLRLLEAAENSPNGHRVVNAFGINVVVNSKNEIVRSREELYIQPLVEFYQRSLSFLTQFIEDHLLESAHLTPAVGSREYLQPHKHQSYATTLAEKEALVTELAQIHAVNEKYLADYPCTEEEKLVLDSLSESIVDCHRYLDSLISSQRTHLTLVT